MKTRLIPALSTLCAAAITSVFSLLQRVSFSVFLKRLAIAVAIFLVIGLIAEIVIEWNFKPEEEPDAQDEQGNDMEVEDNIDTEAESDEDQIL